MRYSNSQTPQALPGKINRHVDNSFGMKRIEITCANCDGHLGHVFEGEGYKNMAGEKVNDRHCVNSVRYVSK